MQLIVRWKGICLNWDIPHTDTGLLSAPEVDPLENLLIEHPSMSVYQMRCRMIGAEEGELGDEEDEEEEEKDSSRFFSVCTLLYLEI